MKIGTALEAKQIYDFEMSVDHWSHGKPPKGWRFIGDGASRNAYLSPSRIVYKYDHTGGEANQSEYTAVKKLRRRKTLPPNFKIPNASIYRGGEILAMEYVKPSKRKVYADCIDYYRWDQHPADCRRLRCPEKIEVFCNEIGIYDFHTLNVLIDDDGNYWPIDLAA